MNIMGFFIILLIILSIFGPLILTAFNLINLFKKKKIKEDAIDILTFVFGILLSTILYKLMDFKDYDMFNIYASIYCSNNRKFIYWINDYIFNNIPNKLHTM